MSTSNKTRASMDAIALLYNDQLHQIADYWNGLHMDDFAVVIQPVTENLVIPNGTYVSHLDCFHPNLLADETLAIALWNSMITPAADKVHGMFPGTKPLCATEDTLLYID
eukprot:m.69175 g.69175  ORF g.69175 m.69175 type:complete len:110 (-) comp50047_c0_seq1:119-448(-)